MTEQELRELEECEKKATPGPWKWHKGDSYDAYPMIYAGEHEFAVLDVGCADYPGRDEDAAFIARARQAIPALIAEVRKARGTEGKGSETLACPYCTGEMQLCGTRQGDDFTHDRWWMECKECHARGPSEASSGDALLAFKASHGILKQNQENTQAP